MRIFYAIGGIDDDNYTFDVVEVESIKELIDKIIKTYYFPLSDKCDDLNQSYNKMLENCDIKAKKFDFRGYLEEIVEFVNKVYNVKRLSREQAKGLLIVLSVLTPALAEQIKEDVLNLKEPLVYYSWPEKKMY